MAVQISFLRRSSILFRCCVKRSFCSATDSKGTLDKPKENISKEIKISGAIQLYMKNVNEYENMLLKEKQQFELGRRHLANIMGEDPENFGQEQINEAISYLFPSSLDPLAKPVMKPPEEVYPKRQKLQSDLIGRPLHTMFYAKLQNFFMIMREAVYELEAIKLHEDNHPLSGKDLAEKSDDKKKRDEFIAYIASSSYYSLKDLQDNCLEKISDHEYKHWVLLMDRIVNHSYGYLSMNFISKYRNKLQLTQEKLDLPQPQIDPVSGLRFSEAYGQKKYALAEVRLFMGGSGKISLNGKDLLKAFRDISDREQFISPLIFTGLLGKVNIEATLSGGGPASQSNAARLAISRALSCFLSKEVIVRMRLAGLLAQDMRLSERKKPGQPKARRKPTWKAR